MRTITKRLLLTFPHLPGRRPPRRYEIVKEFAPYVGLSLVQFTGATANYVAQAGDPTSSLRVFMGLKVWFWPSPGPLLNASKPNVSAARTVLKVSRSCLPGC
jgi:Copper resistance protein B precursor (CopB)